MLKELWKNWDPNALLVKLWTDPTILEGNLELCSKGYRRLSVLWPSHITAGFIPQRDHRQNNLYKNIYSCTLCGGKKIGKWRNVLQLENGWTNCGICWWWNTIVLKGTINWRNSMWIGMASRNWCRVNGTEPGEHFYTETDTLWYNWM